jgi:hypothetical protein
VVGVLPKSRYKHTTPSVSVLDRTPHIVAAWADDVSVRLRSRRSGQCAARRRALSVAFLPALPAAAVHRLAADVRCVVCRVGAGDGGHGRRGGSDADPGGVSRRPLRRAAISGRRGPLDDPVDRGDGAGDRLLAGGRAGIVVGDRQLSLSPGGLRDPQRVGGSGEIGAVLRLSHLYRSCRVCRRPAGHGRADAAAGLARRVAVHRPSGHSGRGSDPVAEPHPHRPGAGAAPPRGKRRLWARDCC